MWKRSLQVSLDGIKGCFLEWTPPFLCLLQIPSHLEIPHHPITLCWISSSQIHCSFFFFFKSSSRTCLLILQRGKERQREKGRETSIGCLLYAPWPGTKPTTRHVPWAGIKPMTFLVYGMMLQPTEPHQPGLNSLLVLWVNGYHLSRVCYIPDSVQIK